MNIDYNVEECEIKNYIDNSKAVIFTDETVNELYRDFLSGIERFVLPKGESAKSFDCYLEAINFLIENNFNRKDFLISFGGGNVSDIAGFTASTHMRGMRYISIPTTLLSMCDASIGGKNGINLKNGKNLIGSFYNPERIFINADFLSTLPRAEFINGMAEIIKIAIIYDRELIDMLDGDFSEEIIRRAVEKKIEIVARDEKDTGIRHLLNYGHTIGHAIEARSGFKERHGFAVAMGMIGITDLALKKGKTSREVFEVLLKLLKKYDLDLECDLSGLWEYIIADKKIEGDYILISYPEALGEGRIEKVALSDFKRDLR